MLYWYQDSQLSPSSSSTSLEGPPSQTWWECILFYKIKSPLDRVPGTRRNYISGYWVSYKRFQMDMNTRDKICSNISSAKKPAVIPKWWSNLWDRCSPRRHSRLYQARKRLIFPKTDSVIYHTFCYTFTSCQDRSKYPHKKICRRSLIRIPED